jgi:hypothetical protein
LSCGRARAAWLLLYLHCTTRPYMEDPESDSEPLRGRGPPPPAPGPASERSTPSPNAQLRLGVVDRDPESKGAPASVLAAQL